MITITYDPATHVLVPKSALDWMQKYKPVLCQKAGLAAAPEAVQAVGQQADEAPDPPRTPLAPMPNEDGTVDQWYFDCDGHYIDVAKDSEGKYSVYFVDRKTGKHAGLDQADEAQGAVAWDFYWLVELRPAFEGHPSFDATYYAGWMVEPWEAAKTTDPTATPKFTRKEDAEAVAARLGYTISCVWTATQHGFASDRPAHPTAEEVTVKVHRNRIWIVKGVQWFMLAHEAETDAELQWYADTLRTVLSGLTPCVKSDISEEVTMLKREIHNLKRHIEDYCQPDRSRQSGNAGEGVTRHKLSEAEKAALAEAAKTGATIAEMDGGGIMFINRGEQPGDYDFPTCPTCHGSGHADDAAEHTKPEQTVIPEIRTTEPAEHAKRAEPERAAFDAWANSHFGGGASKVMFNICYSRYYDKETESHWQAWQAGRASIQQQAGVPEGCVLVPDDAHMTDEQAEAIAKMANCCGGIAYDIYRAAIAAAPTLGGAK